MQKKGTSSWGGNLYTAGTAASVCQGSPRLTTPPSSSPSKGPLLTTSLPEKKNAFPMWEPNQIAGPGVTELISGHISRGDAPNQLTARPVSVDPAAAAAAAVCSLT
jgi:hypothetical protein